MTAPPTAPVCTGENVSVGGSQSVTIDLTNNCTDVNGNGTILFGSTVILGPPLPGTPCAAFPCTLANGTINTTATPGVFTYTNTNPNGGADGFGFIVPDSSGLTSVPQIVNISILSNDCDATAAPCSLTQVIDVTVTGTTMTMHQAAQFVTLAGVTLNGEFQLTNGSIQPITVTNARGTSAGWSVTGQVSDFKVNATDPSCSGGDANEYRLCIPANNLAWGPSAGILHTVIPGDVAR